MLAGCGGGSTDDGLLTRLSPDSKFITVNDLDAMRESLGLPDDADPADAEASIEFARAAVVLSQLSSGGDLETLPALDLGQANAIAASAQPEFAIVISTEADLDAVASSLEEAGYGDEDGVLTREGLAVALGDGLIGIAETAEEAEALIGEPADEPPPPFADADIEGPVVSSTSLLDAPVTESSIDASSECLAYLVTIDDPGEGGEIVFFPVGEPDPELVDVQGDGDYESRLGEPQVEGDSVRVTIDPDPDADPAINPLAAYDALRRFAVNYDCGSE